MKISVIIPSYKPGGYLWDCLDSLCRQTLDKQDYEIIIVLNGCNQPYHDQIDTYIKEHDEISVSLRQTDTPGVSNARNIGIDESHGDYLAFVDDDDIVSSSYLEELLRVSTPTCVGCANSYAFIDSVEDHTPNFLTPGYESCHYRRFSLFTYRKFLSPPWAKLIHKSIIGNNRFPVDMKKSEDSVFCLQISPKIKDMKLATSDAIYYQRLREGSAMRKKESYCSIIKEHLFIEYKYLTVWIKSPIHYNFRFFLSRIVACVGNCIYYIKRQRNNGAKEKNPVD